MRRSLTIVLLFFALIVSRASATTVTGTVTDADSTVWANGAITFTLTGAGGPPFYCAGALMTPAQTSVNVSLDASGAFSTTLCDNSTVTPVNTKWAIRISSATSAVPVNITPTTVSGSSQSLSTYISGLLLAIRIPGTQQVRAYTDTEVVSPIGGTTYFNLTSKSVRLFDGTSWTNAGGSGAVTKISSQTLASPAASVTFSNIPATYTNLKLVITARATGSSATNANVFIQLNGDTGNDYDWQEIVGSGGSTTSFSAAAAANGNLGNIAFGTGAAGASGSIDATIVNYLGTTFWKNVISNSIYENTSGTSNTIPTSSIWHGTAAITSITILDNGSTFVTGSNFTLYGLN